MSYSLLNQSFYAHSSNLTDGKTNPDKTTWEPLFTPFGEGEDECQGEACEKCQNLEPKHGHLNKVAYMAGRYAEAMFKGVEDRKNAHQWGYLAGLWHDLGKFSSEFQSYIRSVGSSHSSEASSKVDHTSAGARHAASKHPLFGHLISTAIAGHHSGLLDAYSEHACLAKRLDKAIPEFVAPEQVIEKSIPALPAFVTRDTSHFSVSFLQRMFFSCLVDSDFLATEAFMNAKQSALRPEHDQHVLSKALDLLERKIASFGEPKGKVNVARKIVYDDCISTATTEPGIFSLTVPTGGGKTLASLAFALSHAIRHGHKKIIYVIPFTSIIEQNAEVFKELLKELGSDVVLEHHSNLSPDEETASSRLAAENWDAPIVVTTTVQFYESLFARKTSKSRKLHNLANAVVILDEAQSLPVQYLTPCLRALEELSDHYGTSTVLCTATQPAINKSEIFPIGLDNVTEIIADTTKLFASLVRTKTEYRQKLSDQTLVDEIAESDQSLCIVNTRNHAQKLFKALPQSEENFHLSALMTPNHRVKILDKIRARLEAGLATRLISTQLIEAGVDIDFPLVYRSMAGLDSISQAAGRCNRNGKIQCGKVFVFHSEHTSSERFFQETASVGHQVLDLYSEAPLSTDAIKAYFNLYYYQQKNKWDSKSIMEDFKIVPDNKKVPFLFQYKTASDKFKLIENNQIPIIIPNDSYSRELVEILRNESIPLYRKLLRSLQRYTVQIYENQFFKNQHQFESLRDDQFQVLICPETHYSDNFGLNLNDEAVNSNSLIC